MYAREYSRERERERVINNNVGLKPTLIMLFALLAVVGVILYCGFKNIAAATPDQVNFNPVTIRNGAKIHVNGDKTLTSIGNGNKLVADNTNGTPVKGSQIESELNAFATNNYGDDAFFKSSAANNPSSLSEAELNAFRQYLPAVDGDYWLSNETSQYGFGLIGVEGKDNTLLQIKKTLIGKSPDGTPFAGLETSFDSYDFSTDYTLDDFTQPSGTYLWSLDSDSEVYMYDYLLTEYAILIDGDEVYNNPFCIDDPSKGYYKSILRPADGQVDFITGKVEIVGGSCYVRQVRLDDVFNVGDILYYSTRGRLDNETGFRRASDGWKNIYFKAKRAGSLKEARKDRSSTVRGLYSGTAEEMQVKGLSYEGGKYNVRPSFAINDKNSFIRPAISSTALSASSSFGNLPESAANYNEDIKLVINSADTTITNYIADNKLTTEKSTNNHAVTKYTNGVIQVPYGAKTLTIDSSAFNTSNANYISALANVNGTQKYAVLAKIGQDITIDLASIVNNTQVGSVATVSFYAEQANPANTSDVISETPVTVEIEVVEGPEQTIRYDLGGGSGNLPSNATVKAGKSYTMADGSGLNKDGNLFSCWQLTYTPYGEIDEVTRLVKANEAIVVPDVANGTITATAMYSGIGSLKDTNAKSSVVTVTWDSNAPDGTTATFTGDGTFNDARTQRYDKIKLTGSSVSVPSAPTLSVTMKVFDGWYTDPVNGTKVSGATVGPIVNTTYYAHWLDGYKVTYDATGGTGATQTGKWSDGTNKDVVEVVLLGASTKGPSKGIPVADDSLYMFYGWYTQPNGGGTELTTGTSFDALGGSKTVYAYYGPMNTFLAPATSTVTANPRNISGDKYTIAQVKAAATDIASNGTSSSYYSQYTSWMNADSYHLYTLLNGTNASSADSWVEFRIVNVGQLDSDGSGLTFQAVHMLPTAYQMNATNTNSGGWASCALRAKMQAGGEIYNVFDTQLTSRVLNVTRNSKGKLWIPSYSELTGTSQSIVSRDGSQLAYWKRKVTNPTGENSCLTIAGTRSGGSVASLDFSGGLWWERSPSTNGSNYFMYVFSNGHPYGYNFAYNLLGVVPCLSL